MDVTLNIGEVINFIVTKIGVIFDALQGIKFLGTNMLAFSLTLMILGILLPIIYTIARGSSYNVGKVEMRKK